MKTAVVLVVLLLVVAGVTGISCAQTTYRTTPNVGGGSTTYGPK